MNGSVTTNVEGNSPGFCLVFQVSSLCLHGNWIANLSRDRDRLFHSRGETASWHADTYCRKQLLAKPLWLRSHGFRRRQINGRQGDARFTHLVVPIFKHLSHRSKYAVRRSRQNQLVLLGHLENVWRQRGAIAEEGKSDRLRTCLYRFDNARDVKRGMARTSR